MSTSRAPSATSYVSSTTLSHNLENGEADESIKVDKLISQYNTIFFRLKQVAYFSTFIFILQQKKIPEPLTSVKQQTPDPLVPVLVHTTLIRDQNGLGFSIAGGKGSPAYKPNSDAIFISRITDGGVAQRDGKLCVGDKVVSVSCKFYFYLSVSIKKTIQ